jgi:hypothetical protein
VIEDGQATYLAIDGHRLALPPRLASLVRQLREHNGRHWTLARLGAPVPWLFPGRALSAPPGMSSSASGSTVKVSTPTPAAAAAWPANCPLNFPPRSWLI